MCGCVTEALRAESVTLLYLDLKGEYSPLLVEEKSREKQATTECTQTWRLCLACTNEREKKHNYLSTVYLNRGVQSGRA